MNATMPDATEASTAGFGALVASHPRLTREDEFRLGEMSAAGVQTGRHRLVLANLGYVASVAREYQHLGMPFDDLFSEGTLGLLRAADRFDHRRGTRFITYAAWWVRKSMLSALSCQPWMVRVPAYQWKSAGQAAREAAPAASTGEWRTVSLEEAVTRDGRRRLIDTFADDRSEDPEREVIRREQIAQLRRHLSSLSERERMVIARRFGLTEDRDLTLKEIGELLGLTRERVRQIEAAAREKLHGRLRSPAGPAASPERSRHRSPSSGS